MTSVERRLLLASGLMLFLELALIRWLGSNVVHLSYFSNFVLLGSFLGIGLGFLLSRGSRQPLRWSPVVLGALVAFVHTFPVQIDQSGDRLIYFTSLQPNGPPAWVALPIVFVLVAAALTGPAWVVGGCFAELPPLRSYRLDLLGSITGIVVFTTLSFLGAPPLVWGALVAAAFGLLLAPRPPAPAAIALVVMVALLALESFSGAQWSPYYKITKHTVTTDAHETAVEISVNGVPHQFMRSAQARLANEPQYGTPYKRLPRRPLTDVLIIGAGSGSDVAIALRMGAQHVDAVEIDPKILGIGKSSNPDGAYQDPRVTTHVNDGRAFLQGTKKTYDLILFALPDSLALVTGASAIRLESFLFTEQAVASARAHLKPTGGFAMYNYYRQDWLIGRLARTVHDAFGHAPCVDLVGNGGGQAVISAGARVADQSCDPAAPAVDSSVAPATDDKPFLYFRGHTLPSQYVLALALVLLLSLVLLRAAAGPFGTVRPYTDLFFMGAAFLLLETRSVATFALLFGTTWLVNALVFFGVLVAVLLAVETTNRFGTPPRRVLFPLIWAALALAWAVPTGDLLSLSLAPRLVLAIGLAFLPVFLANLAFSQRFKDTSDAPTAFGVNVLGAMVGGCLEYGALLTGYRALLIVVGVLYGVAFLTTPRPSARVL